MIQVKSPGSIEVGRKRACAGVSKSSELLPRRTTLNWDEAPDQFDSRVRPTVRAALLPAAAAQSTDRMWPNSGLGTRPQSSQRPEADCVTGADRPSPVFNPLRNLTFGNGSPSHVQRGIDRKSWRQTPAESVPASECPDQVLRDQGCYSRREDLPVGVAGTYVLSNGRVLDANRADASTNNPSAGKALPLNSVVIAVLIFVCVLGGALAGLAIRGRLPANHQDEQTRDTVKLVMGLVATIAALVLSLLIASAHSSYDRRESEVQELGVHIVQLDQVLAHYGPEADDSRAQLRRIVEAQLLRFWPNDIGDPAAMLAPPDRGLGEKLYDKVAGLAPKSDAQRSAQDRALQLVTTMRDTRRLLYEQAGGALSWPFFVVLVFWLVALFVGFGLLAPRNATVVTAFTVGALTVAGAIFLILEMNRPYSGLMQISSAPIRNALAEIGR